MRLMFMLAMALSVAMPAVAATEIKHDQSKRWAHKPTGVSLPPTLAGLPRKSLAWFSAPEVDVSGDYWSADGNDTITVYLYRNTSGDVPMWADRARFYILNMPDKYGAVIPSGLRAFTPRGQSLPSGLMESYQLGKWGKSSALAVLPFNGFYAKFRVTSKTRDVAGIEALLWQAVNAFDWSSKSAQSAAIPIVDCASPLPARATAKLVERQDRIMAWHSWRVAGAVVAERARTTRRRPCRNLLPRARAASLPMASSIQWRCRTICHAIHDGGRAITVGRNGLSELLKGEIAENEGKKDNQARYTVSFVHLDKVETFGDFGSLPLPDQALEQVEKTRPVSVAGTWGKKNKEVSIGVD